MILFFSSSSSETYATILDYAMAAHAILFCERIVANIDELRNVILVPPVVGIQEIYFTTLVLYCSYYRIK